MYIEENGWMLELIFDLSSQALIQMIISCFIQLIQMKKRSGKNGRGRIVSV